MIGPFPFPQSSAAERMAIELLIPFNFRRGGFVRSHGIVTDNHGNISICKLQVLYSYVRRYAMALLITSQLRLKCDGISVTIPPVPNTAPFPR